MLSTSLIVLAGAFAGGFVSGLTGFGTGITALPIWLLGIPPVLAAPLVVACSLVAQLQTLPAIWHAIDFRRCAPFILGGLAGVVTAELGTLVLLALPGTVFGAWLGRRLYNTLDSAKFEKAVLIVLMLSGFMLLASVARA